MLAFGASYIRNLTTICAIWGVLCQQQVSRPALVIISHSMKLHITEPVGCNYLSLPQMPTSGTALLISISSQARRIRFAVYRVLMFLTTGWFHPYPSGLLHWPRAIIKIVCIFNASYGSYPFGFKFTISIVSLFRRYMHMSVCVCKFKYYTFHRCI